MPAKTGKQYIDGLKKANNNVYIGGERVEDVTTHPAFKNVIQSMANLLICSMKNRKKCCTSPRLPDKKSV